MEESEDNISAEDIKDTDLFSFKVKPKKRSMVERELETSLTARITSPRTSGDSSSTSRYGRARRLTVNSETEKTKPLKSPKIEGLITLKSPVYKMHASNSPIKVESPSKNNLQCKLEHQIENIYNENISLSRFGSAEKKQVSPTGKTPKVYVRKDLIQNKEREETVTLIQNMFSPIKSNTHLKNVLERSSDKFDLSSTKKKSYLDNSSVVKTLDFDGKKKRKDKDAKQPISQSDLEAQCEYQAGDLAWARMGTYPYWPCIVTKDPVSGTFVKKKLFGRVHHDVIHVTFFGDNGRRSWIVDNMLRKFKGQMEFECARETFTPEARKKDPRYAAFIVSEKKLPQWSISVEEAERLVREPKRLRTEILNDMLQKSRSYKTTPKGCKKTSRTNSDVSFSESLYGTLFLEDDSKAQDTERSKSKTRKNSRDMSEVVTACIDNMAAKTGITKIQKQSHMDRWLEKAKSKTPEKTQLKSRISTPKTKLSVKKNKAVKSNDSKKPFRFIINDNDNESLDGSDNKLQSYHNEHDYSNQYCISSPVIDVDDSLNELPEITSSGIGIIAKDEGLSGVHNSNSTQDDLEVLTEHVVTGDIIVEPEDYLQDAISETTSQNDYENIKRDIQMEIDDEINTIHDNNLITSHKTTPFQNKELKIKKNNSNKDLPKISLKVFNNSGSNENNAEIDNKDEDGSEFKKSKKLLKTAVNVFTNEETINSSMEWSINCEDEVTTATVEKKSNNFIKNSYDESSKSNKTDFLGELNNVSNCKNAVKDNPEYKGNKTSKIDLKEGEDMIVIDDSDTDSLKSVYKTEKIDKKNSDRNKLCKEDKINQSKVPGNENDANLELPMPNIFLYNSAHVPEDECVCPVIYPNNIEEASITDASKSVIDSPIPIDEVVDSPNKIEQYSLIDVQYGDVDWNLQGIENEKMSQGATGKTKSKCISADIYLNTDINKNTERNSILDITKEKNMGHSFGELDKLSSKNSTSTTSDCDNDNLDEPTENSGVENVDEFISDISVPNGYRQSVLDILDSKCKGKNYDESNNSSTSVSVDKITYGDFSNRKSSEGTIDVTKVDKCVSADINRNAESNRIFGVTKEKSVGPLFRTFRKDNSSSKNSNYTTSDCDNDNLDEPTESSGTENVDESTSDISTLNGSHQSVVNNLDVKSPIINDEDSINSAITMNGAKISQSDFENATKNVEKLHHTNNVSEITNADDSSNIITDREKAKYASNSMACDNKGLIERTVCRMDIELNYPEASFQNKLNKQIKNIANSESSDKFSNVTSNNNTKLNERNSKNTIVEEIKGCNLIDKNKETDADTASTVSTESEMSLSLRRQRWRAEKQKPTEEKAALVGGMEDPEFLKYVELKQDAIYDEHPELSQEDITVYLYNTWKYEESLKTDVQKTDDLDHANLPKGLQIEPAQPRKARRRANKFDVDKTDVTVKQEVPKQKTKRKTSKPYYNEELYDLDDDDDDIEYFEIFRNKKQGGKTEKAQTADGHALSAEEDDTEEVDEVEEYFAQLIRPKPNVFRGLLRERVCEICEMTGNLVKCKGCHCMFHVDCVKKEVAVVELPAPMKGRKKKKKLKGRKSKSDENFDESNSDDKSRDTNVSEDANTSIENDMESNIVANVDDFEAQLAIKMKELLGDEQSVQYDSVSSEDELDWSDTEAGKCEVVDIKLKQKKLNQADYSDFKCNNCQKYDEPVCFVCRSPVSPKTKAHHRQRCQVPQCNKYFHLECLEHWPQTQFNSGETARYNKKVNEYFEALSCPRHVCHTCVSDDPRGCKTRFSGDKLAKCVRCPATYHSFTKCLPAGTQILTGSHIICPRHYEHRPGKVPCHVNTGWCFICALGGTLICCEYCPTSFHAECLNIKPPEGGYMCEDCETGRLPLYGEMVWVKLGHYRWWPGIILHPSEIPENIFAVKHSPGEFVVRFFGQYDHYWVNRGRVFPFQEGDSGKVSSQRSKIDAAFTMAMEHAQRACEILKAATPNEEESLDIASSLLPPHYVKLRVNKPCGSLVGRRTDAEEGSLTQCECSPSDDEPCGPYSQCLNRMLLTECGPTCRAGDRCNNRAFEKRLYPKLVPYRTPHRGWGLKTLEDIKAGQFVIEYVGELIDEAEFERRMRRKHDIRDENFYFLTLDKERMIDAGPKGNLARFMNHCCEPNCETQKWTVLGDVRVGLFALYDIPANSEVTFNYNLESTGVEKKRCMCGAKRCSGYIGAKPKQSEPQKKPKVAPVKRSYKKRKIEDSPTTSKPKPKLKQGRPIKPRELTEIEKDLLIIKNATNGLSSDSECSDRLSSIESCSRASKRRRVGFSTEEMSSNCSSPSTSKRLRLEKCSDIYE